MKRLSLIFAMILLLAACAGNAGEEIPTATSLPSSTYTPAANATNLPRKTATFEITATPPEMIEDESGE